MPKRIPLYTIEPSGIDRSHWPITQGIPFPDKELARGEPVAIFDGEGNSLPVQSTCLTTWNSDLKFVKWLLLDFQAHLKAGSASEFFLEYGNDAKTAVPDPVTVEENGRAVTISTGVLELRLFRDSPDFFGAARIKTQNGWHDLLRGNPGPFLHMKATMMSAIPPADRAVLRGLR